MLPRALRQLLQWLLALLILFEEWGWEPLHRAMARIARWPGIRTLERWIGRLPPYPALVLFVLPGLALLPVKLAALWLIGRGHALLGLAVVVAAKVLGTAVVARLYTLVQPALRRLAWFERFETRWAAWKADWLGRVRASWPWRASRVLRRRVRRMLRRARAE